MRPPSLTTILSRDPPEGVAGGDQQALVVVPVAGAGASAVEHVGQPPSQVEPVAGVEFPVPRISNVNGKT